MHDDDRDEHNYEIQEATNYLFTHEIPYMAMSCVMVCGGDGGWCYFLF